MEEIYAALLLHKIGKQIDEEGIKKVLQAAGAEIEESKVKNLVASLKDVNIDEELKKAVVSPTAAPSGEEVTSEEAKEETPKEEKKEAAAEGLASLFG